MEEKEKMKMKSRMERKARKLLEKVEMQPVADIQRICIRKAKDTLFFIDDPEIYKVDGTADTYVVYGEAKIKNLATERRGGAEEVKPIHIPEMLSIESQPKSHVVESDEESEGEPDATGVTEEHIEKLIAEGSGNVTRKKAIRLLKKHNDDLVDAMMDDDFSG